MKLGALAAIAWRDVRATRARSAVSVLGIALGVAVLVVIAGLGLGTRDLVLREVVQELPVDMVEVVQKTVDLGLFKVGAGSILGSAPMTDATVKQLTALPQAAAVYPKLELLVPFGARGGAELFGQALYTDLFVNGLPEELVAPEAGPQFRSGGDVIPVVISPQLIEIFNASVAPGLGIPGLTAAALTGFEFDLSVGRSLMLGRRGAKTYGTERACVVGVSRHALRLGASIPLGTARALLSQYASDEEVRYGSILVRARSAADVPAITQAVRSMGYDVDETARRTSQLIGGATALASLVGLLVLVLAALNITHSFFAALTERRRELAILRSVGARRVDVLAIVLFQATLLGVCGGALGVCVAHLTALAVDAGASILLPSFPFKPESFFVLPAWLDAAALTAALVAALAGALWPAARAARAEVVTALVE